MPKKEQFMLSDLPNYAYTESVACPECYRPSSRNRADGRCDKCLADKKVLPVNYCRAKKRADDEDEDRPRKYDRDE